MKDPNNVKRGKISRKKGKEFERKTKEYLESEGWVCVRWDKQVEFNQGVSGLENGGMIF